MPLIAVVWIVAVKVMARRKVRKKEEIREIGVRPYNSHFLFPKLIALNRPAHRRITDANSYKSAKLTVGRDLCQL